MPETQTRGILYWQPDGSTIDADDPLPPKVQLKAISLQTVCCEFDNPVSISSDRGELSIPVDNHIASQLKAFVDYITPLHCIFHLSDDRLKGVTYRLKILENGDHSVLDLEYTFNTPDHFRYLVCSEAPSIEFRSGICVGFDAIDEEYRRLLGTDPWFCLRTARGRKAVKYDYPLPALAGNG